MIGKISIGKSFGGCIRYCLEDKLDKKQQFTFVNRAEVLEYNLCFGNKHELTRQFNEVRQLNQRVSKPVMHFSISFAPEENIPREKLLDMTKECALKFGFENNQYLSVYHKDTNHQHLHIVANRIGLDGKTVSDSQSYKKIAEYCRKMELKHELKQVLSPRLYLNKEQRLLPRFDQRKERLKKNIRECLRYTYNYEQFKQKMQVRGYQLIKGRGIAFVDDKGVRVKGSEMGYSLKRIEQIFEQKQELKLEQQFKYLQELKKEQGQQPQQEPVGKNSLLLKKESRDNYGKGENQLSVEQKLEKQLERTLDILLKPEYENSNTPYELLQEHRQQQRKKKQQTHSQH